VTHAWAKLEERLCKRNAQLFLESDHHLAIFLKVSPVQSWILQVVSMQKGGYASPWPDPESALRL
jgi:hypothetical protein